MMQLKGALQNFPARAQLLERLPWTFAALLTVFICYRLAELAWYAVPTPELNETISPEAAVAVTQVQSPVATVNLSQRSLFGRVEIVTAPVVDEPVVVPETRLNLTLVGVIASSSKATAKAIIGDASGNEEFYSIGMQVPGGASLEEVHPTHVMLKRNNRLEMLRLPSDEDLSGINSGQATAPSTPQSRRVMPANVMSDNRSTGALLRDYRDALNQDPQSVMDLVRAEPVREGDRLIGYRISPGRDRQLLSKFGLRAGDVVTAVNGVHLDNPIKGLEVLQTLQSAGQMSIDVTRNGVAQSFSFVVD